MRPLALALSLAASAAVDGFCSFRERPSPAAFAARLTSSDIVYSQKAMEGAPVVLLAEPRRHVAGVSVPAGVANIYTQPAGGVGLIHHAPEHGQGDGQGSGGAPDDAPQGQSQGQGQGSLQQGQTPFIPNELIRNHDFGEGLASWESRSAYVVDTTKGESFGPIGAAPMSTNGKFAVAHTGWFWNNNYGYIEQAVTVPMSRQALFSMVYNFVTAEYPTWQGTMYNDYFSVTLTGPKGEIELTKAEFLNSSQFKAVSGLPAGIIDGWPPGQTPVTGGQTGWKVYAHGGIPLKGGLYTLRIDVRDVGDDIVDSAILVDRVSLK